MSLHIGKLIYNLPVLLELITFLSLLIVKIQIL